MNTIGTLHPLHQNEHFRPPIRQNIFSELAPPQGTGIVKANIDHFVTYMHARTYNEHQQINIYINGLRESLK
jgi:hypothetical protein